MFVQLEEKLEEMSTRAAIMEDMGPTSCGIWCFGLFLGCASCDGGDTVPGEDGVITLGKSATYTLKDNTCSNVVIAQERCSSMAFTSSEDIISEEDTTQ